jgi:uncharacterized membrane protein
VQFSCEFADGLLKHLGPLGEVSESECATRSINVFDNDSVKVSIGSGSLHSGGRSLERWPDVASVFGPGLRTMVSMTGRGYPGFGFGHYGPTHAGFPLLHLFVLIALLVLIGLAIVVLWRMLATRRYRGGAFRPLAAGSPGVDPLGILRMRYARGEIGRSEFMQANADLGGAVQPDASAFANPPEAQAAPPTTPSDDAPTSA